MFPHHVSQFISALSLFSNTFVRRSFKPTIHPLSVPSFHLYRYVIFTYYGFAWEN